MSAPPPVGYGKSNWANRTLWTGDNLDILRGMNSESVDLIYLDPPFNSNKDYEAPVGSKAAGAAFRDTWNLSDLDVAWMGLVAEEEPAIAYLLDTAHRTHSEEMQSYLTMMAVRLLEMRRLLKKTGSIYLHCDPTASHYLKMIMDAIFGRMNFRNEIVWRRKQGERHNLAQLRMPSSHDNILWYAYKDSEYHIQYTPYSKEYIKKTYKFRDNRGNYATFPCTNESGGNSVYEFRGISRAWRYSEENMEELYKNNMLTQATPTSPFRYKKYLDQAKGIKVEDIWGDIPQPRGSEKTGYPTQKPLALLERIIKASSNEGDVVLDPFCGCATACVAAEKLERQWVGIDISAKAAELVNLRLQDEIGSLFHRGFVTTRTDIPRRTDIDAPRNYRENKHILYGQQEGRCGGCETHFEFRHFEVDHIVPRSRGGTHHIENLQLLCGHCNRVKGDRPQEYLMAQLAGRERIG